MLENLNFFLLLFTAVPVYIVLSFLRHRCLNKLIFYILTRIFKFSGKKFNLVEMKTDPDPEKLCRSGRVVSTMPVLLMTFRNTSYYLEGIFVHLELFAVLFLYLYLSLFN